MCVDINPSPQMVLSKLMAFGHMGMWAATFPVIGFCANLRAGFLTEKLCLIQMMAKLWTARGSEDLTNY